MTAARPILFIGKFVQDTSSDMTPKMILIDISNHSRPEQGGPPQYNNKDNIVSNFCILVKKLHEAHIDPRNETLKD